MSTTTLRNEIAAERANLERGEIERNRIDALRAALDDYRSRRDRGIIEGPPEALFAAFDELLAPATGNTVADRREALRVLVEPAIPAADLGFVESDDGRLSYDEAIRRYQRRHPVPDPLWRAIDGLCEFARTGDPRLDALSDRFERAVEEATEDALDQLEELFGLAADAARGYRDAAAVRLNTQFDADGTVTEEGLVEQFLAAAGDDPMETLEEQPVALLPVGLETRFVDGELLVRVYPDQIHADAHEDALTDREVTWAKNFWAYVWLACHPADDEGRLVAVDMASLPSDRLQEVVAELQGRIESSAFSDNDDARYEEVKERAWGQLLDRFDHGRAAYIVHAMAPLDGSTLMLEGPRVDAEDLHAFTTEKPVPALEFPTVPRRPESWTRRPTAELLPDRWVAYGSWLPDTDDVTEADRRIVRVEGNAIREPLPMGLDPESTATMAIPDDGEDDRDDPGGIPEGMEWMVDFETAERAGMALRITDADVFGREPELALDPALAEQITETTGIQGDPQWQLTPDDVELTGEDLGDTGGTDDSTVDSTVGDEHATAVDATDREWELEVDVDVTGILGAELEDDQPDDEADEDAEAPVADRPVAMPVDEVADDEPTSLIDGYFERLVVLGVKTSMDPDEGTRRLRDLFDSHHYTDGLAFLRQGTPTNNAEEASGYSSRADPAESVAIEAGPTLVATGDHSDGDVVARMLGIDPGPDEEHVFAHVENADMTEGLDQRHMNSALWPGTIGYYLRTLLAPNDLSKQESIWPGRDGRLDYNEKLSRIRDGIERLEAYRRHFVRYVRANGPFPAIRVGTQPYGLLPVTPVSTAIDATVDLSPDEMSLMGLLLGRDTDFLASALAGAEDEDDEPVVYDGGADESTPPGALGEDVDVFTSLGTWLARFGDIWGRSAARSVLIFSPDNGTAPFDLFASILSREPLANRFTRRQYFSNPRWIAVMAAYISDDLEDDRWHHLMWDLRDSRDAQLEEIRRLLRRNDATLLDPRIANFVYQPFSAADGTTAGDIEAPFVHDADTATLIHLADMSYQELLHMGYEFPSLLDLEFNHMLTSAEPIEPWEIDLGSANSWYELMKLRAKKRKAELVQRRRRGWPDEPMLLKSLFRHLARFSTIQAHVAARLRLGVRYDDLPQELVKAGAEPISYWSDPSINEWITDDVVPGDIHERWLMMQMAASRGESIPDEPTYADVLSAIRSPPSRLNRPRGGPTMRDWDDEDHTTMLGGDIDSRFREFMASLYHLAGQSSPILEDLFRGTLDLASHRFDAWWTSLATRRLFQCRHLQGNWTDNHYIDNYQVPLSARGASPAWRNEGITDAMQDGEQTFQDQIQSDDLPWGTGDADGNPQTDGGQDDATTVTGTNGDDGSDTFDGAHLGERADVVGPTTVAEEIEREVQPDVSDQISEVTVDAGIYVGGYAFGEDLRPDEGDDDAEFVLTPSLQQATTTALLRSGYEVHADTELGRTFAVDLSAERVRTARQLLDGVRQGMTLGELLGYRFERSLHDRDLSTYIHDFREKAPAIEGRLERTAEAGSPGEDEAARSDVVDGYKLFRMWKDLEDETLTVRDVVKSGDVETTEEVFEELEDAIDAVGDLITAESVHQFAQGNMERASASIEELVGGNSLPEPEVDQTPRSATGVTHRTMVLFGDPQAAGSDDGDARDGWPADTPVVLPELPDISELSENGDLPTGATGTTPLDASLQVRDDAEPRLDAWLADLLPDPRTVEFRATYHWEVPVPTEDTETGTAAEANDGTDTDIDVPDAGSDDVPTEPRSVDVTVTLADLECGPLDLLALEGGDRVAEESPLEGHLAYYLLRTRDDADADVPPDATVEVHSEETADPEAVSLASFMAALRGAKRLVTDGRPIDGTDLTLPGEETDPAEGDAGELQTRADRAQAELEDVRDAVGNRIALLAPDRDTGEDADGDTNADGDAENGGDEDADGAGAEAAPPSLTRAVDEVDEAWATFAEETPLESMADIVDSLAEGDVLKELADFASALPIARSDGDESGDEIVVDPDEVRTIRGSIETLPGARYAVGTFRTPASSGRVSVTDVGFEPDAIVLRASSTTGGANDDAAGVAGTHGWSHGKVARRPDGSLQQNALCVASDSHSRNTATGASVTDAAVALVLHDDGEAGRVTGAVTATNDDGFDVELDVDLGGSRAGDRFGVTYEAVELPPDAWAEVGHFRTPTEAGTQEVPLSIDADRVVLTGTNVLGKPEDTVETALTTGLSHGEAIGRSDPSQWVISSAFDPGSIDYHSYAAADDSALWVLFQSEDEIAGQTKASVRRLGESIQLEYEEIHDASATVPGSGIERLVTYLAIDSGDGGSPVLGSVRTPDGTDGDTVTVNLDFRPAVVEFTATPAVGDDPGSGVEVAGTTEGAPFGWSHGVALDAGDGTVRQRVISDGINSESTNAHAGAASSGAAIDVLYVAPGGTVTGRDRGRVTRFRDDGGFDLEFPQLATSSDSDAEHDRALVFFTAWPHGADPADHADDEVELRVYRTDGVPDTAEGLTWEREFADPLTTRVTDAGWFSADVDFAGLPPGARFRVTGRLRDRNRTMFSRAGHVRDDRDVAELAERLPADFPVMAGLLRLRRVLDDVIDPDGDTPGRALHAALEAVETLDPTWEVVDGERQLVDELLSMPTESPLAAPALDSADEAAIAALVELGRANADPETLAEAIEAVLTALDRLGVTDLVGVQTPLGDPDEVRFTVRRGSPADRARIQRATVDPVALNEAVEAPWLEVGPGVATHVESPALGGSAPPAFGPAVGAFLDGPDWIPAYLDATIDRDGFAAPAFLADLAAFAYRPGVLGPSRHDRVPEFERALDAFLAQADELSYLDQCFVGAGDDYDAATARSAFVSVLRGLSGAVEDLPRNASQRRAARTRFTEDFDARVNDLGETLAELTGLQATTLAAGAMATALQTGVLEALRIALVRAAYFGVYGSVPQSAAGATPADERALLGQAKSIHDRLDDRVTSAQALDPGTDASPTVDGQRERLQALFGDRFEVLVPFVPPGQAELDRAFAEQHQDRLLESADPLAIETWLQQMARVRDRPALLSEAYTLAESLSDDLKLDLRIGQLPYRRNDDWVGLDGVDPEAGRLSLVAQLGTGSWSDVGTSTVAGILVDNWVERAPADEQSAGIAMEYDDPNQEPPQSILLAAPPASGGWTRGELETTLLETFDLLKIRAVDLDDLDELGHFLPGLCFPLSLLGEEPFGKAPMPKVPSVDFDTIGWWSAGPRWLAVLSNFEEFAETNRDSTGDGDGGGSND